MTRRQKGLLIVICAGMVLSWFHAWASFIMPLMGFPPFSITNGALILVLSTGLTSLHQGRGWRLGWVIAVQTIGLAVAVCRMVYVPFDWKEPFWPGQWLSMLFTGQHTFMEWLVLLLTLFWTGGLYIAGIRLVVKAPDRVAVSERFDLGAAAFLSLLLIQLIMIGKGIFVEPNGGGEWGFLAFFILGLLALGMGGDGFRVEKGYLGAYGGMGTVLSFMILVMLLGGGLVILFLPSLMSAAEVGHEALKTVARPLVPVLTTALRFIFLGGCRRAEQGCHPSGQMDSGRDMTMVAESAPGIFHEILTWVFMGLALIIVVAVFVWVVYWLSRWLAVRTHRDETKEGLWGMLIRLLNLFKSVLLYLPEKMMRKKARGQEGAYPYARLERWGVHSGMPRIPTETPLEYGVRLGRRFPGLEDDFASIVGLYNQSIYGLIHPDGTKILSARDSLNRARDFRHWPARIRAWFLSPSR